MYYNQIGVWNTIYIKYLKRIVGFCLEYNN